MPSSVATIKNLGFLPAAGQPLSCRHAWPEREHSTWGSGSVILLECNVKPQKLQHKHIDHSLIEDSIRRICPTHPPFRLRGEERKVILKSNGARHQRIVFDIRSENSLLWRAYYLVLEMLTWVMQMQSWHPDKAESSSRLDTLSHHESKCTLLMQFTLLSIDWWDNFWQLTCLTSMKTWIWLPELMKKRKWNEINIKMPC